MFTREEAHGRRVIESSVMEAVLDHIPVHVPGCIVEVGVFKGGSGWSLDQWAQRNERECFLYDTFTGIPYTNGTDDAHKVGDFGDTVYEEVCAGIPHATVTQGIFPGSAVPMPPVCFAHIDVDQYQSYIDTCTYLAPLMSPGGIMWFDDGCLISAWRAITELYGERVQSGRHGKHYVRF